MNKCLTCDEINCLTYYAEVNKILQCNKCGAVYSEYYTPKKYWYTEDRASTTFFERILVRVAHHFMSKIATDEYLKYLRLKTKMNFKNALDIGAGYGTFVNELNKIGIDAYGIESEQKFVKSSITKKIKWEYFDKNYYSDIKYDLICLTGMIFYLPDNYAVLECVRNMLTPNGIIFIIDFNPESKLVHESFLERINYEVMILSKKNFESLQKKLGLELLDYTIYRSNLSIDFHRGKNRKIAFLKYFLRLKNAFVLDPEGQFAFILLKSSKS